MNLEILLLGKEECPTCRRLEIDTINALSELGISAKLEHITKTEEVVKFGVGIPAFILDGKAMAVGRAPSFNEIKAILSHKLRKE